MNYTFDWSVIPDNFTVLLGGLGTTFTIAIAAETFALVLGLIVAMLRTQRVRPLRFLAICFVDLFRAIPLLVLLIWLYYGLTIVTGINLDPFTAGVLGLGLVFAANLAEVYRSGLEAIPPGQREAAYTLGLSRWQTNYAVVVPQAVRLVLPALGNSFIAMLKDATLVSILGLTEIMRRAQIVVAFTFRPFEIYTFVALVYLVIVVVFSRILAAGERRAAIR